MKLLHCVQSELLRHLAGVRIVPGQVISWLVRSDWDGMMSHNIKINNAMRYKILHYITLCDKCLNRNQNVPFTCATCTFAVLGADGPPANMTCEINSPCKTSLHTRYGCKISKACAQCKYAFTPPPTPYYYIDYITAA